jgi:hypothetical protein
VTNVVNRLFNSIFLAAAMILGIAAGLLLTASWPTGFAPGETLTITASILAAIGTWAVGIGAMHYAQKAHELRLEEGTDSKMRECIWLRAQLINCQLAEGVYNKLLASADGRPFSIETRHTILRSAIKLMPEKPTGVVGILPDTDRALSHSLDAAAAMLTVSAEQFISNYPVGTPSTAANLDDHFGHLIGQLSAVAKMAKDLSARTDGLMTAVESSR